MGKVLVGLLLGVIVALSAVYALKGDEGNAPASAADTSVAPTQDPGDRGGSPKPEATGVTETSDGADSEAAASPAPTGPAPSAARPEFDALFKSNPTLAAQHTRFESEARDHPWASDVEATFQQVLASNPEVQRYGQPEVECRSSRCEVRLMAYGASHVAAEEWSSILSLRSAFFDADGNRINPAIGSPAMINSGVVESGEASAIVVNFLIARPDRQRPAP